MNDPTRTDDPANWVWAWEPRYTSTVLREIESRIMRPALGAHWLQPSRQHRPVDNTAQQRTEHYRVRTAYIRRIIQCLRARAAAGAAR